MRRTARFHAFSLFFTRRDRHRVGIRGAGLVLLMAVAAAGCDPPVSPEEEDLAPDHDLAWLQDNAIPFRTAEPGGDYQDLMPLKDIIGDARIVALGEGTHGTREFFLMKHRILQFLVEEMDFELFSMEATWGASNSVNDYVHTGVGVPEDLLADLRFWTWNTQEVLDMIEWMRRHNQTQPDPTVSFSGFDMQSSWWEMDEVKGFLSQAAPYIPWEIMHTFFHWRNFSIRPTYATASDSIQTAMRDGIADAYDLLVDNEIEYVEATSEAAYARALRAARILVQHEHYASRRWRDSGRVDPRDEYMAENLEWVMDQAPDSRVVLWAHNEHVRDREPMLGSFLRDQHGDDVVIIGFSFHHGRLNAYPNSRAGGLGSLSTLTAPPAAPESYEWYFDQLEHDRFMVDLRPLRHDPPASAEWLLGPRAVRAVGAAFSVGADDSWNYRQEQLPFEYDVWIHFRETEATRLLPM